MPWPFSSSKKTDKWDFELPKVLQPTIQVTGFEITRKKHPDDPGLCVPLTSLYTKYQLGVPNADDFLFEEPETIYQKAVKERKHQEQFKPGGDYLWSAFGDCKVPYEAVAHPRTEMDTGKKLQAVAGKNNMATYQTPEPPNNTKYRFFTHTIGFGQDRDAPGKCYLFDSNRRGFLERDSCDYIYDLAAGIIKRDMLPQGEKLILARELPQAPEAPDLSADDSDDDDYDDDNDNSVRP